MIVWHEFNDCVQQIDSLASEHVTMVFSIYKVTVFIASGTCEQRIKVHEKEWIAGTAGLNAINLLLARKWNTLNAQTHCL